MTAKQIKDRINEICTIFEFDYKGKNCAVDPFSKSSFVMWYGDNDYIAHSIDDVMSVKLFDGKSLTEIVDEIENVDGL